MKEKLDTLSDAIIAIAITILVLEIHGPQTAAQMSEFIQQLLFFALSFVVIANFWYERMFFTVQTDDASLSMITLDLIIHFGICLIPLMTKVMFTYESRQFSVVAYGILILIVSTLLDIKGYYIVKYELNKINYERKETVLRLYKQFHIRAFSSSIWLVILSYFFPYVIVYLYSLIPVIRFLTRSRQGRGLLTHPSNIHDFADNIVQRFDELTEKDKRQRA